MPSGFCTHTCELWLMPKCCHSPETYWESSHACGKQPFLGCNSHYLVCPASTERAYHEKQGAIHTPSETGKTSGVGMTVHVFLRPWQQRRHLPGYVRLKSCCNPSMVGWLTGQEMSIMPRFKKCWKNLRMLFTLSEGRYATALPPRPWKRRLRSPHIYSPGQSPRVD